MIIRSLDDNWDWQFGKGKQSYLNEAKAIEENLKSRLWSFLNDCFFDMGAGLDWIRLLGSKNTKNEILLSCRAMILKSFGVVRINDLSVAVVNLRDLILTFNIDTIYSQGVTQSVSLPV